MCNCCPATDMGHEPATDFCLCGAPATQAAFRRVEADLTRREMLGGTAAVLGMFAGFGLAPTYAWSQTPGRPLLLTNLRLFDGTTLKLREGIDILVEGNRIAALPTSGLGPADAQMIDCGGRAVTPGLID
jgi:hypothetical protein